VNDVPTEPLIVPFTGGLPVVSLHLDVASVGTQIVNAILRPDLAVTHIAEQWRSAVELSEGAAVLAQLATSSDAGAQLWGPCEMITPTIEPALDAEIDPLTAIGGLLLGRDLLGSLVVMFIGPLERVAIITRDPE